MSDTTTDNSGPGQPFGLPLNDLLGLAPGRAKVSDAPLCEQMQELQARAMKLHPIDLCDPQLDTADPYTRLFLLAEYWQRQANEARACLDDECDRTDSLLTIFGLEAEQCRSEGGALVPQKVLALMADVKAAPEIAHLRARLDDALFVLGMVDKNNRIDAGETGKAWNGRFVVEEVRRVLGTKPLHTCANAFTGNPGKCVAWCGDERTCPRVEKAASSGVLEA